VKFAPKRSASKYTSNKMGNAKSSTTKRVAQKWSRQKDVLPGKVWSLLTICFDHYTPQRKPEGI